MIALGQSSRADRPRGLRRVSIILIALSLVAGGSIAFSQDSFSASLVSDTLDRDIAEVLSQIERYDTRAKQIDAEIGGLDERKVTAHRKVESRARALYRLTRVGMLPLSQGFDSLLGHISRVEQLKAMVKRDIETLSSLDHRGKALAAEAKKVSEHAGRAHERLLALRERKSELTRQADIDSMFERAFEVSRRVSEPTLKPDTGYGMIRYSDERAPEFRFADARGRLPSPLVGTADVRPGNRGEGPGLELIAPGGTPVRAVARGRVAFAERYGRYGLLVILDHGDDYFTLYGGLENLVVQKGDVLGEGARLGAVSRAESPPALFFEVRRGTRSLEPGPWLGL